MRKLIFEDNFTRLDRKVWSLRNIDKREDSVSVGSWQATAVTGGKLRLFAQASQHESGLYNCGHIGTENSFQFTYGYVEARIKFHPYQGAHGAVWLQTSQPYSPNRPEIDIAEYFGVKNPDTARQGSKIHHNVYYRDTAAGELLEDQQYTLSTKDTLWHKDFHVYGLDWKPDGYDFYIDDELVATSDHGLSDTPKYLILSMIMRDYEAPKYRADKAETYKTSVDWIRVFQDSVQG